MVNVVLAQSVLDERLGLGFHPRCDEGRKIQRLPAVEHEAGVQQAVFSIWRHAVQREP
jgi:hypothetical protein